MDETSWEGALRHPAGLVTGGPGGFAARLHTWLADAQVEGSAGARAQEHWLRAAAEADGTFTGVLVDLAERGTGIAVGMRGGRRHHGRIEVIGADFLALHLPSGSEVLLTLEAVTAVRTAPMADATVGEQVVKTTFRLTEVLGELAAERARVLLVPVDGADAVAGELRAVGHDVVTVRSDGDPPTTTYVPLAAIAEVALA